MFCRSWEFEIANIRRRNSVILYCCWTLRLNFFPGEVRIVAAAVRNSKSRNHLGGLWQSMLLLETRNCEPTREESSELIMLLEIQTRNSTQEGFCGLTASARVLPAYSVLC
jgi:hypothetical protein